MGVVVAARHERLGSLVALKFMLPQALENDEARARFNREARAVARLRGEHIARVIDFGELDTGAPYIVMEFLEGSDLAAVLQERGPLPIREALAYVLDVCKAMEEAHKAGIVHRDLKPKNLFLTHRPDGTPLVKVLDFGISKLLDGNDGMHAMSTRTDSFLGTPIFMSPEQVQSAKYVDARTDIYALGAVIYRLTTKRFPFRARSFGELFARIFHQKPIPLRTALPDAPIALEAIVARCLQKDPKARFQSVTELAAELRAVVESMESSARDVHRPGAIPAEEEHPRGADSHAGAASLETLSASRDPSRVMPPAPSQPPAAEPPSAPDVPITSGDVLVSSVTFGSRKSKPTYVRRRGALAFIATFIVIVAGGFLLHLRGQRAKVPPRVEVPLQVETTQADVAPASASPTTSATAAPSASIKDVAPAIDAKGAPVDVPRVTVRARPDRRTKKPTKTPAATTSHLPYEELYDEKPGPTSRR
ncbi:serine/threonine protein kinase [Pendulispora albinea]|uniref:Serine/threonine protein kinase n=2 Tax=Pendulispora albinea TaxID=2741071 RepID=A0ABZ2MCL0_9BACT